MFFLSGEIVDGSVFHQLEANPENTGFWIIVIIMVRLLLDQPLQGKN